MNLLRGLLLLAVCASPVLAQPKTGQAQPDRLAIGTVYTGAIVEASFLVYEAGKNAAIKLEVKAPKFVKVLKKTTEAREFGKGNDFVYGLVELSLDTSKAGKFEEDFVVTLGATTVKVPVSATVKDRRAGKVRVLIAETPFEAYTTNDGGMFQEWTDLVGSSSIDVSYLLPRQGKSVLRDLDLSKYEVLFLPASALVFLTDEDVKKARAFAEKGGRVVVAANAFMVGSVKAANKVLDGYGLEMRDTESRNPKGVTLTRDDLAPKLQAVGVKSLEFFRASPIAVTNKDKARVLANAVGVGEKGDGFVVTAKVGKGEMIVIGQSLWWSWIHKERAKGSDNAKLLRWLLAPPSGA